MSEYPDLNEIFCLQWPSQNASQCRSLSAGTATTSEDDEEPSPVPEPNRRGRSNRSLPSSSQNPRSRSEKLSFVEEKDWDPQVTYDKDRFHYLIEWKVRMNNKAVATQSEPTVVVSLGCYWRLVLQERLRKTVEHIFAGKRQLRHNRTKVVVTVTGRSQPDFTTEYDEMEIDWDVLDEQLLERSRYFQKGQKLLVKLFFSFVEANTQSTTQTVRRVDKRGRASASSRMLVERGEDIATEHAVSGRRPIWPSMYAFLRCPTSCELGPHCWIDEAGLHHRMTQEYFRIFEAHVAEHGMPATHNDMPSSLQRQLIADRQKAEQRRTQASTSHCRTAPINITNVLPNQFQQVSQTGAEMGRSSIGHLSEAHEIPQLEFSGLRDDALRQYITWHQSRVRDPRVQAAFEKAYEVALKAGLFLESIYEESRLAFFIEKGVPEGVAWYICRRRYIETFDHINKRPRLDDGGDES